MKTRIHHPGTNSLLEVVLEKGEGIKAESGAMVSMSSTIDVEGKMEGGFLKSVGRMFAGEKFFFQTLKANRGNGSVLLAPALPGDLSVIKLDGKTDYILEKNGFLAGDESIEISATAQNLAQGFLSGEGFFVLKARGRGMLAFNSFGAIHELKLGVGEKITIDNHHLVAWPADCNYTISKASGGWISSFTSGEGIVCKFVGPANIYIQTRSAPAFSSWIRKIIPSPKTSKGGFIGDIVGEVLDFD